MARRFALLVAATRFEDARLVPLAAPAEDAAMLAEILSDPERCGYEVSTCIDAPSADVRRRINRFFRDREPDDLLLLYISTHGLKDESGSLYFAAADTSIDEPESSTVESHLIHALSRSCRARQQLLILDACFSGAFGREWTAKDGAAISKEDIAREEPGQVAVHQDRGLVVFTASTSYQSAFEDAAPAGGQPSTSLFTRHLVEGLRSGAADLNGDGVITEDELYRYALKRTRDERPRQTPQRWVIGAVGELAVGRSAARQPVALPDELVHAMASPITRVRLGVVAELGDYARGAHKGHAMSAQKALEDLAGSDDSRTVQEAARNVLSSLAPPPPAVASPEPRRAWWTAVEEAMAGDDPTPAAAAARSPPASTQADEPAAGTGQWSANKMLAVWFGVLVVLGLVSVLWVTSQINERAAAAAAASAAAYRADLAASGAGDAKR